MSRGGLLLHRAGLLKLGFDIGHFRRDGFGALLEPLDLLKQFALAAGHPLHMLLAGQLLFLHLAKLHARSRQLLGKLPNVFIPLFHPCRQFVHLLLASRLIGFQRLLGLSQCRFLNFQFPALIE